MAFDDLSNSEKESYNQGLKDEYSRLMNDYQRREFREQLRDTFQVSGSTGWIECALADSGLHN